MLKLLHAADFHLDSPFQGLTAQQAVQRRSEQRELLDRLAELAQSENVDLVLLAGDLFDSQQIYRETAQVLADALGRMPCPVFLAPGNHDCYGAQSPYRTIPWPENVHLFSKPTVEAVELPELNCVVHGAAFTAPYREEEPLADFRAPEDGRIHLMVLHGDVGTHSRYGPISETQIASSGLDYLALGHVHACSGVRQAGNTAWAYPGCPEGRGFDELGDKGVLVGTVEKGRADLRFVPLCKRRYEILDVDITDQDTAQAVRAALAGHAADICRVRLMGTPEERTLDLDKLTRSLDGLCWQLSLRDHTSLRRDLWARAEEDNLTGLFLRELRTRLESCGPEEREQLLLAAKFGLAALENGEDIRP